MATSPSSVGKVWTGRPLDLAAPLDAAGAGHPAVLGEGVGHAAGVAPRGVHPEVLVVVHAVDVLLEVEGGHGVELLAVDLAGQHPGAGEGDVAGVVGLAEGLPGGVVRAGEDLGEVARVRKLREAVHVERLGADVGDEGGVRRGRDAGHPLQDLDVRRAPAVEVVVPHQHAEGVAAERAVLLLVDLLEGLGHVELDGPLEVVAQLVLRDVQDADLEALAGLGLADEVVQPAPGAFELLQRGIVQDLVHLGGQLLVDGADPELNVRLDVLADGPAGL
jgi:hypothetical protein